MLLLPAEYVLLELHRRTWNTLREEPKVSKDAQRRFLDWPWLNSGVYFETSDSFPKTLVRLGVQIWLLPLSLFLSLFFSPFHSFSFLAPRI